VEPDPGEGVFRRAQRDTQQFCVSFRGLAAEVAGTALAGMGGAIAGASAVLTALSGVAGFFAVVGASFCAFFVLAPLRQRNEAREALAGYQSPDEEPTAALTALIAEFERQRSKMLTDIWSEADCGEVTYEMVQRGRAFLREHVPEHRDVFEEAINVERPDWVRKDRWLREGMGSLDQSREVSAWEADQCVLGLRQIQDKLQP